MSRKRRLGKRERAAKRAALLEAAKVGRAPKAPIDHLFSKIKSNIDPDVLGAHGPRYKEVRRKLRFEPPKVRDNDLGASLATLRDLNRLQMTELVKVYHSALEGIAGGKGTAEAEFASRVRRLVLDQWARRTDYFHWPTTLAPVGSGEIGDTDWEEQGLLNFVGYAVGGTRGKAPSIRRLILNDIFLEPIPLINSREYTAGWGIPNSARRLQKLAESIASFTRNAKRRRTGHWELAIRDWETDLKYLHDEYYVGQFDWPST